MLRFAVSVACLLALATPSRADCPDKPIGCAFGAVGTQGMCWHTWRCTTCGAAKCPTVPAKSYTQVPNRTDFACLPQAIKQADGCSNPSPDPASVFYKGFFKPACDQHDVCYRNTIGRSKGKCDDDFKANMDWMCDRYFTGALNLAQRGSCRSAAVTWWAGVANLPQGQKAFDADQQWAKASCVELKQVVVVAPPPVAKEPVATPALTRTTYPPGLYHAQHPDWSGSVLIQPDGTYVRVENGDPGTWTFDGTTLTLAWTNWGPEPLTVNGPTDFRSASGFSLTLVTAAPAPGVYHGQHPDWSADVTLSADGTYHRNDNGDPGKWTFDGTTLTLTWANWGPEPVTRVDAYSYRSADGRFTLSAPTP